MRVHFILHEEFEAPAALEAWAKQRGHASTYSRVYQRDMLPQRVRNIDLLVIMGGPQSPDTTTSQCLYFDSAAEQHMIATAIAEGVAVIGFCLGAQLIGEALGARFEHSEHPEIGVFPIWLTTEGQTDPHLAHLGPGINVAHWHNDMPGLTTDAIVLASSSGCSRQIIRYGPLVYGFQCHMEFTRDSVQAMIANCADELATAAGQSYVQDSPGMLAADYNQMNAALFSFLDRLTANRAAARSTIA